MKSAILYPYDNFHRRGCCGLLNPKHAAITAAIYALVSICTYIYSSERSFANGSAALIKNYDALFTGIQNVKGRDELCVCARVWGTRRGGCCFGFERPFYAVLTAGICSKL